MPLPHYEVLIAGGGPVGLLLANRLGQCGIRTLVVERRLHPSAHSMAIGITPPSLAIMRRVGLDAACIAQGVPIARALVYDRQRMLGGVDFGSLPAPYPFILSLPQAETGRILEAGLRLHPSVTHLRGATLFALHAQVGVVRAELHHQEGVSAGAVEANFLVGCDGHASTVRDLIQMPMKERRLGQTFLMADFSDGGQLGRDACLWFTETGSVESFPLPGGRRRWVVQTSALEREPAANWIADAVRARAGFDLAGEQKHSESPFLVREFVCRHYFQGRVVLCGDAAHVMSPIGGQGMNTGFGDADLLAGTLAAMLRRSAPVAPSLRYYEKVRRRAFRVAARRATRGMWLGTRTGAGATWLRSLFISRVLLQPPFRDRLPPYFAMLTVPGARA